MSVNYILLPLSMNNKTDRHMTPDTRLAELQKKRDKILSMEGDKYLRHFRELCHIQQSINALKRTKRNVKFDWGFKEVITRK